MTCTSHEAECCSRESTSEGDCCWICLDAAKPDQPLLLPCACPQRFAHRECLAKWQLTSAGKEEEKKCRFCATVLPDWRPALTPEQLKPAASVMSVRYRGVTYRITYMPGPDGLQQFLQTLQSVGIKVASASQVTFLCRSPDTGAEMALKGLKAFDAAAYCASITAAKRLQRDNRRRSGSAVDCGIRSEGPESPTASGCLDEQLGGGQETLADGLRAAAGAAAAAGAGAGAPAAVQGAVQGSVNNSRERGGQEGRVTEQRSQAGLSRWQRIVACIPFVARH